MLSSKILLDFTWGCFCASLTFSTILAILPFEEYPQHQPVFLIYPQLAGSFCAIGSEETQYIQSISLLLLVLGSFDLLCVSATYAS